MTELKNGWRLVKLGDVVDVITDYWDRDPSRPERFVAGEHIDEGSLRVSRWGMTNDELVPPTFNRRFKASDVLFHSRNLRKLAQPDFGGITGEKIFILRTRDPLVLMQELLPFLLQSPTFTRYTEKMWAGSTNKFLNKSPLVKYELALPPPEEQQRLVKVLASSNTAVCVYDTAAESSIAVIASELDDHFLRGIDKFRAARLGEVADIRHGYAFPGSDFVDFESGSSQGLPVLVTPKNFTEHGELDFSPNRTKYFKGAYPSSFMLAEGELTVLMTDLTPSAKLLGAPALINRAALQNQRIGLVRLTEPSQARLRYLFYMLCCGQVRRQIRSTATGTTVRHTSPKSIKGCSLPLPSLAEQDLLVHRWDDLTKARSTISERGRELRKMHYATINALLGKSE